VSNKKRKKICKVIWILKHSST